MLKFNIILAFCIIGISAAATTQKPKTVSKVKDVKEKRDAALASGPYSYEAPIKSFQVPIHSQPKAAVPEYHQSSQKVAPLEFYQQKQQAPIHVQQHQQYHEVAPQQYHESAPQQQHYHESAQQYPTSFGYPTAVENLFGGQSLKGFGNEYSFSYPGLESFNHMPIVHYNQELNKINSAYVTLPGYKSQSPSFSSYKGAAQYQPSYSFGSPAPAYSFPAHSYSAPQHLSNFAASAPSGPSGPSEHSYYSHGFSQSPSAVYIPQAVSFSSRPAKTPDYAVGSKGLGHYSTVSSISSHSVAPTQQSHIRQQSYEVPSYAQFSQTERPFKASSYLGSSHVDSHSEQSIESGKPAVNYLPPRTNYLPAKEQQHHYTPEQSPVEYQIKYIQAPAKSYLPPSNNYLPPSKGNPEPPKHNYLSASPPKSSYLPPSPPKSNYLPPSPPKSSYLPANEPSNNYLPPNNPYQSNYHSNSNSAPSQYQQQYQQDSFESSEYQTVSQSGHQ